MRKVKSNTTLRLVICALMAAMTCVATMVITIPIAATGGYINLGDCIVLLSGVVLGPLYGAIAAGLGSALADLLSGYVVYSLGTFIIKGCMAAIVGYMIKSVQDKPWKLVFPGILAEAVMILEYFGFEALVLGYGLGAASGIIGNAIQGVAGLALAFCIMPTIRTLNIEKLRQ